MPDARIAEFTGDAQKILQYLHGEYGKLQTGRANASLVEHMMIEAYGQKMDLRSVAGISIQDAKTIVIQPWDRGTLQPIEKAIQQSDIGINPVNDGIAIRINLPPMTEERREQLKKIVQKLAEEARISVRQARQKAHDTIKQDANETEREGLQHQLQREVDAVNEEIDEIRKKKEEEIMTV